MFVHHLHTRWTEVHDTVHGGRQTDRMDATAQQGNILHIAQHTARQAGAPGQDLTEASQACPPGFLSWRVHS